MNEYPNYILLKMAKDRNQEAYRIVKANRMCKASRSAGKKAGSAQGPGGAELIQSLMRFLLGRSANAES